MVEIINFDSKKRLIEFDEYEWKGHEGVPEHTRGTLLRYRDYGMDPGGFLTSVLTNDLFGAIGRADMANSHAIKDICTWVSMRMPAIAWGDPERVDTWINLGGIVGRRNMEEEKNNV